MKVSYQHIIAASVEKVLEAFASKDFYEKKQKNSGAVKVEIINWQEQADGKIIIKGRVTEPSRLPGFLKKSDLETFTDDTVFDPKAGVLTWKVTPGRAADKFFLSGKVEFFERGDNTRVIYNTELKIKMPLVGSKAEKIGLSQTEKETADQAEFLKKWVGVDLV